MKSLFFLLTCLPALSFAGISIGTYKNKPKLVVFFIFDQLRADELTKFYSENKASKGYKKILEQAAWFPAGEYQMLQNMTGPGHATLLSGSYPYRSGIALNEWYNAVKKASVYCTQDDNFQWLSGEKKKGLGTSPINLSGSTLGDELKNASPKSRVISIAVKDRAAILMGGHRADLAVWLDPGKITWTSTEYYLPDGKLPSWIEKQNQELVKIKNELVSNERKSLLAQLPGIFPQGIKWGDRSAIASPAGLEITEKLALSALKDLKLGQKDTTDFLLISFSSHDYVGHSFGPHSDAIQEMLKAEDALLDRMLSEIKKTQNGTLDKTLIVLSSDHGVAPNPEWSHLNKLEGGRFEENKFQVSLESALSEKFGKADGNWILQFKEMNIYLNATYAEKKGIDFSEVQKFAKSYFLKNEAITSAFTKDDYEKRTLPPGILEKQILNSYVPGRSGHVVGILKPFYVSGDETANHETGYAYDRTVPIVFFGKAFKPGVYASPSETVDIAPTLAFLLGVLPPSNSSGKILHEAFR